MVELRRSSPATPHWQDSLMRKIIWPAAKRAGIPFRFPFRKTVRDQAVGSSISPKEEDSARIQTDRNQGCGLAHFSALGWNHLGGNGRTSAHDPRLFAAQQPPCHKQIPAGDFEGPTVGAGQIGRRYLGHRYFAEDKPDPMNSIWERFRMGPFSSGAYRPLTSP